MSSEYDLYVPVDGTITHIKKGSAIVGERREDRIHVHYEGSDHMDFEGRLQSAAGRMSHSYPTIAQAWLEQTALIRVGRVTHSGVLKAWVISELDDPDALAKWAGDIPAIGGSDEIRDRAAGMAWSKLSPSVQAAIHMKAQGGADMTALIIQEIKA